MKAILLLCALGVSMALSLARCGPGGVPESTFETLDTIIVDSGTVSNVHSDVILTGLQEDVYVIHPVESFECPFVCSEFPSSVTAECEEIIDVSVTPCNSLAPVLERPGWMNEKSNTGFATIIDSSSGGNPLSC